MQEIKAQITSRMAHHFHLIRQATLRLVDPLQTEDFTIQASEDVSPTKWHLAHTTWFFETFVLTKYMSYYRVFKSNYDYLFNSYYESVGPFHSRQNRGLLTRPTVEEIYSYRSYVDHHMMILLGSNHEEIKDIEALVEIGLNHEQQHQELILTDIKFNFYQNPLLPVYKETIDHTPTAPTTNEMITFRGGLVEIGTSNSTRFSFDNERPRHKVWLDPYRLASYPVTNKEYIAFIEDGGYENPSYWLSDGWETVKREGWTAPLYWRKQWGKWMIYTLSGEQLLKLEEPVCHVSFYEADAFARWKGKRLPTEAEWEHAAESLKVEGNFADSGYSHPRCHSSKNEKLKKIYGDVWEWTQTPYTPYPRSKPLDGALGEYNVKFMCNQMVLRGGSCATPLSHIRPTYRNFFQPEKRWQFSGLRLAEDAE
ncbi:ergothioneine biosynthesis protein EgtB [Priestia koreensis]|uniref:ergothioneine biosynthesis protein EgtB n=1 Tax=Priestia koreensis TaxID=284581 RepID=UPI0028F74298|nr:ergothioneine biosynthesis protein EgtB [Priestia koreensis]